MGFIEKIKNNIDYYKLDKYTKRRVSQSQFESHDRRYYENVYRDGDYIDPSQAQYSGPTRSHLSYKQSRDQYGSQESNQVVLSQRIDENDIRQDEEGLRQTNENDLYDDDDDCDLRLITKTTHKENVVRPILLKKEEEKEDVFEVFADEPNLVPAGSSSGFGIFFDDDDDEDDKENDYADPDLEFSISSVASVPIEDSLLTLSPATEDKVKEVHAPLPYPRGENIVQKLGLEKSSNDDDNDDDKE
ncbi:hypothetical protein RMATCC62417_17842 [Rhizopus microsporus]|nr:hypothetical protein RMATCC62417_17842 [Rhizopus microsporus]